MSILIRRFITITSPLGTFERSRRRLLAVGCVIATLVGVLAVPAAGTNSPDVYEDPTDSVHGPAIATLAAAGVLSDTDCALDRFCPNEPLTPSVLATWLVRSLEVSEASHVLPLTGMTTGEASPDRWTRPAEHPPGSAIRAVCSPIPARYCPDESVTRAQVASILTETFALDPSGPVGLSDVAGNPHEESINALVAAGITAGCTTNPVRYCPDRLVTRGQMATFLARALSLIDTPNTDGSGQRSAQIAFPDVGLTGVKHIIYGRSDQHIWLVEPDGTLFDSYPVSGKAIWPPPGQYEVYSKSPPCLGLLRGNNCGTYGPVP